MNSETLAFPQTGEIKQLGYVGEMVEYTVEKQYLDRELWKLLVNQFRIHSDTDNGWRGEFWGKMMRGGALTYRATKNEKLYAVLKETVLDLLSTQEKNGRISSYPADKELNGWDMWGRKYVMLGLEYFLDVCKSQTLKRKIVYALKRHADYIVKRVGEGRNKKKIFDTTNIYGGLNSCSILEGFVKLYRWTGERKYLDFSAYIIRTGFSSEMDIIQECLDKKLYPYQFKHTKAYEMMSCFEGLLEYYKLTGDEKHLLAVENFVDMVVETDYTIIGCSVCTHELFDNSTKMQTEPAPSEVMQETCVTVTFMKLCAKLLSVTGKAKYAEYIEKSGLNAMLGAVNNENQDMHRSQGRTWEGKDLVLVDHEPYPFDSYSPLFHDRRGKRVGGFKVMENNRSYGCCACIGGAGTAILSLFGVMKGEDGYFVNLYNRSRFQNDGVAITVYANPYKKNGAKIAVKGNGKTFALGLRIPTWAKDFAVYVNGEAVDASSKDGYLLMQRTWNEDRIEVKFSMPVHAVILNKKIAFTKGPIVLARDCRFEDIERPLKINARKGKAVRAKIVKNPLFHSNVCVKLHTKEGDITLVDYAQAGKNYDEEHCNITVWQERAK